MAEWNKPATPGMGWTVAWWIGWVISVLVSLLLALSAFMKFQGGPQLGEMMGHLGIPEALVTTLAVLEVTCVVVYLFPPTSVVGAILLTGYMGGAILAHLRVGDPVAVQIALPILGWVGLSLRDRRLRALVLRRD